MRSKKISMELSKIVLLVSLLNPVYASAPMIKAESICYHESIWDTKDALKKEERRKGVETLPSNKTLTHQDFLYLCIEIERRTGIPAEIIYRLGKKESNWSTTHPWVVKTNNYFGLTTFILPFKEVGIVGSNVPGDKASYWVFKTPFDCFFTLARLLKKKNVKSLDDLTWYNPGNKDYISQLKEIIIPKQDMEYMDSLRTSQTLPEGILERAKILIGTRYIYGASGPYAYDCSGFTKTIYPTLDRTSYGQFVQASKVDTRDVKVGDLAFFGNPVHHVGLVSYVGDTIKIIHAKGTGYTVCEEPITQSWLKSHFHSFGRI